MNSQRGLLLDTLHHNESHGRTADRLADRLRVAAVVLVALQIRLHIRRRHQSHVMAITADHPRPVVRGTTSLNSHGAWRKLREELLHRATPKLATQHNSSRSINSVNLKHVLRQIQTNCANLAHGRLPCLVESTSPVWHTDAVGGRPPHHCERSEAIHGSASPDRRWIASSLSLLAMTTLMPCVLPHTSAFSRRENARALPTVTLEKIKGAGNAGRAMRPQPRMQNKKHTSIVTTVTPERPGIPRAMVLTVSFVISPVIGLFCHRRQRVTTRQLDASVEASGPHDFAVRIACCSSPARQRPPHPIPRL